MGAIAHGGGVFGLLLTPLVVRVTAGRSSIYVRENANEGINWQLQFIVLWLVLLGSISLLVGVAPWLVVLLALAALALFLCNVVLPIMGMIKASRGVIFRYPMCVRLFGRSRSRV
jgi:uncharacterized Tic20 family protein